MEGCGRREREGCGLQAIREKIAGRSTTVSTAPHKTLARVA